MVNCQDRPQNCRLSRSCPCCARVARPELPHCSIKHPQPSRRPNSPILNQADARYPAQSAAMRARNLRCRRRPGGGKGARGGRHRRYQYRHARAAAASGARAREPLAEDTIEFCTSARCNEVSADSPCSTSSTSVTAPRLLRLLAPPLLRPRPLLALVASGCQQVCAFAT